MGAYSVHFCIGNSWFFDIFMSYFTRKLRYDDGSIFLHTFLHFGNVSKRKELKNKGLCYIPNLNSFHFSITNLILFNSTTPFYKLFSLLFVLTVINPQSKLSCSKIVQYTTTNAHFLTELLLKIKIIS